MDPITVGVAIFSGIALVKKFLCKPKSPCGHRGADGSCQIHVMTGGTEQESNEFTKECDNNKNR